MAALFCAIAIHIVIIGISDNQHWFDIDTRPSTFELLLLPAASNDEVTETKAFTQNEENTAADTKQNDATLDTTGEQTDNPEQADNTEQTNNSEQTAEQPSDSLGAESLTGKELSERNNEFDPQEIINNQDNEQTVSETFLQNDTLNPSPNSNQLSSDKPELLDLSKVSLSPDVKDEALTNIFSPELRDKITESKKAQKDYLKGLTKEVDYPITKDADGTRYVNIKGVCWKLPKEGSNEGWAIVFDGCGVKSKLFHFELNISPSIITNEVLGPDSPFNLDQPIKQ